MTILLDDTNTYVPIQKDPIKKIIRDLHKLVVGWKRSEYISERKYRFLNSTDGVLPRAYGLPKVHKLNCPLRIIVSSTGTPLHSLAKYLHEVLYEAIPKADSHVENSFKLAEKLSGVFVDDCYKLISLDVVSLFTNVPIELAVDSIVRRWDHIGRKCSIPREEFLRAIRFVLNSTYFTFNGKYYKQTFGTPMGSPLSPIIADLTLQDLENKAITSLGVCLPFYVRYVDDVALAAPSSMLDKVVVMFNSFHPRLQFTMEEGINN